MRDHPLLFSAPMVRAFLAGAKTQTRRIVTDRNSTGNVPPSHCDLSTAWVDPGIGDGPYLHARVLRDRNGNDVSNDEIIERIYSRYAVGDRVWGREAFEGPDHIGDGDNGVVGFGIRYKADGRFRPHGTCGCEGPCGGVQVVHSWKPSIFMPRWASRLVFEITDVRVQRVQAISEADAIAEGAFDEKADDGELPSQCFRALWQTINGPRGFGWDQNPFVYALTLRRIGGSDA